MSDLFIRPELRTHPSPRSNAPAAPATDKGAPPAPKGDEVQKSTEKGQEKVFNESQPKCKDDDKNPCEKDCNEKTSEKDPNEKSTEKDPNEKTSEKDPNEKTSEKDPNEKSTEKDPNEKTSEKDPNEKTTEKDPNEKSSEKDPNEKSSEKDPNEKTTEKDPNEKTTEKDPNEKSSEKDPNEKTTEKDPNEKSSEKGANEKGAEKDANEKAVEKPPEGPPPPGSASITGDPHVALDMNRDGFLTRDERVFDLHVAGKAEDALVYGNTHVDVTTEQFDNGHPYASQVDLDFGGNAGAQVQVNDQNEMQITEMVNGKPVVHPLEPGTSIQLANGVTMTADQAVNRAGLEQNSVTFTEADGTTTTIIQNPHQITGASRDNLDVVVDTEREITAGRNTITGVGAPNDTYTAPSGRMFA